LKLKVEGQSKAPLLVFDIHGVLMGRREPADHRPGGEVIACLRAAGCSVRFLTNSSSITRSMMVGQLAAVGVEVMEEEIYTGAIAVARYLQSSASPIRLVVIGSQVLRDEISLLCGDRVIWAEPEEADTVVVSRDPSLTDEFLERINRSSSCLIATCRDADFPMGTGRVQGPGPTVSRVEAALKSVAHVVGKPNRYVFTDVMGLTAEDLDRTVMIGDSMDQDIALANNAGIKSVLLLDGDARAASGSSWCPNHVILALDELLLLFQVTV
jgi:HAD superfamily hydrolase (TIGR01450 family)